mgnify:CR=1 FL=1
MGTKGLTTASLTLALLTPLAAAAPVVLAASSATAATDVPCLSAIPGVGPSYAPKITNETNQVVLVRAAKKQSSSNKLQFWQRIDGCWVLVKSAKGRNGYAGWVKRPLDGSGKSPIGAFTLTDAGGRLANPGTTLPYHYGPQAYSRFGYKMNSKPVQVFDYVVAINYNRFIGHPPRDEARPNRALRGGGIWFHVNGAGATRGCVSVSKANMAWALRWLTPSKKPLIIMGPTGTIAS